LIYEIVGFPTEARNDDVDVLDIIEIDLIEDLARDRANDMPVGALILARFRGRAIRDRLDRTRHGSPLLTHGFPRLAATFVVFVDPFLDYAGIGDDFPEIFEKAELAAVAAIVEHPVDVIHQGLTLPSAGMGEGSEEILLLVKKRSELGDLILLLGVTRFGLHLAHFAFDEIDKARVARLADALATYVEPVPVGGQDVERGLDTRATVLAPPALAGEDFATDELEGRFTQSGLFEDMDFVGVVHGASLCVYIIPVAEREAKDL
jgi:hypothetical protein